jgi:hypothetical protein
MYVSPERVQQLVSAAGISIDTAQVQSAIDDAAFIVQQYSFFILGKSTDNTSGSLEDENARFLGHVKSNAIVKNLTTGASSKVSLIASNSLLTLTDPITFSVGQEYAIEDLKRYELAEMYKAAALLSSHTTALSAIGGSSERLGPIAVTSGNFGGVSAEQIAANLFEAEFLKIVGVQSAAV